MEWQRNLPIIVDEAFAVRVADIIEPANEQNLHRFSVEVLKER